MAKASQFTQYFIRPNSSLTMIIIFLFVFVDFSYAQYGNQYGGYGNYEENVVCIKVIFNWNLMWLLRIMYSFILNVFMQNFILFSAYVLEKSLKILQSNSFPSKILFCPVKNKSAVIRMERIAQEYCFYPKEVSSRKT